MSHEKGIEAASEEMFYSLGTANDRFEAGLKAYLNVSDMVLVPREPTQDMVEAAYDESVSNGDYAEDGEYIPTIGIWTVKAMIAAAPNPFQTPEESREKK